MRALGALMEQGWCYCLKTPLPKGCDSGEHCGHVCFCRNMRPRVRRAERKAGEQQEVAQTFPGACCSCVEPNFNLVSSIED